MATPVDNVVPLTGNALIDGLTWGSAWQFEDASHVLTYSLSLNDNPNGGAWTTALSNAVRRALTEWSNVANLIFVESGSGTVYDQSPADIVITLTGNEMQSALPGLIGFTLPPSPSFVDALLVAADETRATNRQPEGDIQLDNYSQLFEGFNSLNAGGAALWVMLHEIGHALGLKHSDNGPDGRPTFADLDISNLDSNLYTVMSYTSPLGQALGNNVNFTNASSPMPLDILAIQHIYGANMSYNSGDDFYDISYGGVQSRTIWDAGGIDTITAITGSYNSTVIIDLREGHYSSESGNSNGPAYTGIAYGVVIENAEGTTRNDVLIGNDAANRLDGRAGNDSMSGGAGDDTYFVDATGDVVTELVGEGTDLVYSSVSFSLPISVEKLILSGITASHAIGNNENNALAGNAADNLLEGGPGNDALDGGVGIDTATFSGSLSSYSFGIDAKNRITISDVDPSDGDDGTDTLARMERASFADAAISLEIPAETPVNQSPLSYNTTATAGLTDGGYVIAWAGRPLVNRPESAIYAKRYDESGHAVSEAIRISTTATDFEGDPRILALDDGGYLVAWLSYGQDGGGYGIYAQRYDLSGAAVSAETRVNTTTAGSQVSQALTALVGGGYVATWASSSQDGSGYGIYAQRYDASGNVLGGETRINAFTAGDQSYPAIAGMTDGGFLVTWTSAGQDGAGLGVYSRRFDVTGAATGAETRINTTTSGDQFGSGITVLPDGSYMVGWYGNGADGTTGNFFQRYNVNGDAVGVETPGNRYTVLNDGTYLETWRYSLGGETSIHVQRHDASGAELGSEKQLYGTVSTIPITYSIAALAHGGYVVTWILWDNKGDYNIYSQHYDAEGNAALSLRGDSSDNDLNWASSSWIHLEGGAGNDTVCSGLGNDTLNGGDGNDLLDGGRGADRMEGGSGNDVYVVDHRFDQVVELATDSGIDSVSSRISHVLADNVENLFLTGSVTLRSHGGFSRKTVSFDSNSDATGNAADNLLRGNRGHNQLDGLGGNDTLLGGAGADVLNGGTGADRLVGGAGADRFVLAAGDGGASLAAADMLYDFEDGIDRIALAGGLDFANLSVSQGNGIDTDAHNTVIATAGGECLTVLLGISASSISMADFYAPGV